MWCRAVAVNGRSSHAATCSEAAFLVCTQRRHAAGQPASMEDPTWRPGERDFDLGPFARHRVPEGATPVRLDRWVMKHVCSNWNAAQKLIASRQVWLVPPGHSTDQHRGSVVLPRLRPACQGSTQVEPQAYVYFPSAMRPVPKRRQPTAMGSEPRSWLIRHVLYKDTDFIAINKPAGWSVLPGRHVGGMHLQRLLPSIQFGLEEPPRLVHRLSTELSGVLLLARHRAAASFAKDMIRQRAFWQRAFWGVACGRAPQSGTVSMPLAQEQRNNRKVAKPRREDDGGLPALTEYRTLRYSPLAGGLSLLELNLYSGRHHQGRAHCAFGLRAPLLGDPIYYELSNHLNVETAFKVRYHSEDAKRERKELLGPQPALHLHSRQLRIKTFAGKDVVITAPLPEPMVTTFATLGWSEYLRRSDTEAKALSSWDRTSDNHVAAALAEAESVDVQAAETARAAMAAPWEATLLQQQDRMDDDEAWAWEVAEESAEGPPAATLSASVAAPR